MRSPPAIRSLGVIRGSAVNQDGCSSGLTAPNGIAQQQVIRQALANAGLTPDQITYVEAHGTGTSLGDPIEVEALAAVLGAPRADGQWCAIGSVKTNIGHLEGAAGIAGLMKVVLALQHGVVPPHLHLRTLNPNISLDNTRLTIPREALTWPEGVHRYGGVSSFGFSGTNSHIVLEQPPSTTSADNTADNSVYVLPVSAHDPAALATLSDAYVELLSGDVRAADVCYSASVRRPHYTHRRAVVGRSSRELADALRSGAVASRPNAAGKLAFVFSGHGSQWFGMERPLFETEPVFRDAFATCAEAIREHAGWDLLGRLADEQACTQFEVVQPSLLAVQVALAALWRSWGIVPDAVVGHSMGEIAAAHVAGALTLDDAARVICCRSRLLMRVRGQGSMLAVELSAADAGHALDGVSGVAIGASNGPRSTVLSGDTESLRTVRDRLEAQGVFCRVVRADTAFHSSQMDSLLGDLRRELAGVRPQAAAMPIYSSVTGGAVEGPALDANYWSRNLRDVVQFWPAAQALVHAGHSTFVELSAHPILTLAMESAATALPSLRRDDQDRETLLRSLGQLYTLGFPVEWQRLCPTGRQFVKLPRYPWQRERFWLAPLQNARRRPRRANRF